MPRWRRTAAKTVLVGALCLQAFLLVRGGTDPHKLFGFRPFNESDVWQAEIVRIHEDGTRHPVTDGTWVYDWDELVDVAKLRGIERPRHASAGAAANLDFLDRALDWAVDHIPDDPDTVALEARVTLVRNARAPETVVLRAERSPAP
jgi:hypothetical protein